ncbi:MAG: hypothetical protein MUC36_17815 [Planctomycetes bacterium]|jgi:hypothetical protein|nr:hypothetical protein [Planctomycetota bacterium]
MPQNLRNASIAAFAGSLVAATARAADGATLWQLEKQILGMQVLGAGPYRPDASTGKTPKTVEPEK